MVKIAFYTLGCKSNQYETEVMKSQVLDKDFEITDFHLPSDIYVINTCTVTGNADKKSRHAIRQARRRNPKAKIIVTGCYVEVAPEEIARVGEADIIVRNRDKKDVLKYLKETRDERQEMRPAATPPPRIRTNLMIENGCEQFCSYCIVPYARGKIRSKPADEVLEEARKLVKEGVKEIVLTGINLGAYGTDKAVNRKPLIENRTTLPHIIKDLSKIEGLLRIRLSSLEPQFITEELINCTAETPKVCKHLHIPLQSSDDGILKAMNRGYCVKDYLNLIKLITKKIPKVSLNTDVIVGFPGEDEKAFANTLKLLKKIKFSRIHAFHFSARPGTGAANLPNQVSSKIIKNRIDKIQSLRTKLMRDFAKQAKRAPQEVLVESTDKSSGLLEGLTESYIRVLFEGENSLIGKLVAVKITDIEDEYVIGRLL